MNKSWIKELLMWVFGAGILLLFAKGTASVTNPSIFGVMALVFLALIVMHVITRIMDDGRVYRSDFTFITLDCLLIFCLLQYFGHL
jgi:hypothetical protein